MNTRKGVATVITEAGEAQVALDLRSSKPDGNHTNWSGTLTIDDAEVWKAIANTSQVRIRTTDGRETEFIVPDGAGFPPAPGQPVVLHIESSDGAEL
ncbi:hypothetical protein [Streptomyces sp. NPDC088733]|uniref:hypothetical protein n=1 Tax=Streptomyces sp. NPDC088733 TaxID=3365880 RepID=UPI00380F0119